MQVDFSGNFTNVDNVKDGDLGVIIDEGKLEDKETQSGKTYQQVNIGVEINSRNLTHSLGMIEGKKLVAAWGKESKNWIGKKFIAHYIRYVSQGQTKQKIEIEPTEQKA